MERERAGKNPIQSRPLTNHVKRRYESAHARKIWRIDQGLRVEKYVLLALLF